jgi:hypothetical protein
MQFRPLAITCPQRTADTVPLWAWGNRRGQVRCIAVLARPLHSEHRLKNTEQLIKRSLRETPQSVDETVPIYSPQLISDNMTIFTLKPATHTKREWMSASCERGNNKSAKVSI